MICSSEAGLFVVCTCKCCVLLVKTGELGQGLNDAGHKNECFQKTVQIRGEKYKHRGHRVLSQRYAEFDFEKIDYPYLGNKPGLWPELVRIVHLSARERKTSVVS